MVAVGCCLLAWNSPDLVDERRAGDITLARANVIVRLALTQAITDTIHSINHYPPTVKQKHVCKFTFLLGLTRKKQLLTSHLKVNR